MGFKEKSKKSFEKSDDLIGYKPQQSTNNLPPIGNKKASEVPQPTPVKEERPAKMTPGHFWSTLTALLGNAKTRQEFVDFLKGLFSGKKPKNS